MQREFEGKDHHRNIDKEDKKHNVVNRSDSNIAKNSSFYEELERKTHKQR